MGVKDSTQDSDVIKSPGEKICEHFNFQVGHVLIRIPDLKAPHQNLVLSFLINALFLIAQNSAHLMRNGWKSKHRYYRLCNQDMKCLFCVYSSVLLRCLIRNRYPYKSIWVATDART